MNNGFGNFFRGDAVILFFIIVFLLIFFGGFGGYGAGLGYDGRE